MKTTMKTLAALLGVSLLPMAYSHAAELTYTPNVSANWSTTDSLQGVFAVMRGTLGGWMPNNGSSSGYFGDGTVISNFTDATSPTLPVAVIWAGDTTVNWDFNVTTAGELAANRQLDSLTIWQQNWGAPRDGADYKLFKSLDGIVWTEIAGTTAVYQNTSVVPSTYDTNNPNLLITGSYNKITFSFAPGEVTNFNYLRVLDAPFGYTSVPIAEIDANITPVPTYASWATTNAGSQEANLDWDNDGVTNGVEYFMNAAPGFTANPGLVNGSVTWPNGGNIPSSAYGSQFVVQTSTDLANWSAVASDDITLSNTAGALTWKVASIANGDMGSFTGNLPSSWVVSGGALTSAQSADNSPFTNKFADNGSSWIIDDSSDASGSAGFWQVFSNKTNYPSVEVNFDFKLTALSGGTWGIEFDGAGANPVTASSSVHYRIDASGQFAINAGPGTGAITNILALEAGKWYNVRATFTTTAVNTGSNNGAGVQSGTITPEGGSPVSWSNVPLLNTSLGFSRLRVRDRDASFAGDLLLDNVSVVPLLGKQFARLKVTP